MQLVCASEASSAPVTLASVKPQKSVTRSQLELKACDESLTTQQGREDFRPAFYIGKAPGDLDEALASLPKAKTCNALSTQDATGFLDRVFFSL